MAFSPGSQAESADEFDLFGVVVFYCEGLYEFLIIFLKDRVIGIAGFDLYRTGCGLITLGTGIEDELRGVILVFVHAIGVYGEGYSHSPFLCPIDKVVEPSGSIGI